MCSKFYQAVALNIYQPGPFPDFILLLAFKILPVRRKYMYQKATFPIAFALRQLLICLVKPGLLFTLHEPFPLCNSAVKINAEQYTRWWTFRHNHLTKLSIAL